MNNRAVFLICAFLALTGAYIHFFTDWGKQQKIQIFCDKTSRGGGAPVIIFHLDKSYPLTSVEVVAVDDARTNPHPHPLWHLVAGSAPAKTDLFAYGMEIPGMKPEIATAVPEPLEPGTDYTLLVQAGKDLKGQTVFHQP